MTTSKSKDLKSGKAKKILIIVVLILVLIIIAMAIPRYNRYMKNKRSTEAQTAISEIRKFADVYLQSKGSMSGFTVENAMTEAKLNKRTMKNWKFMFVWKTPEEYNRELAEKLKISPTETYVPMVLYKMVIAIATKENSAGEGKKVWYDAYDNKFHGYGIDDIVEPDWQILIPDRYQ